tara:strand:- start:68 stop:388 length:321 start_codon:yes stop_codon:yes gene_type:complete
MVLTINTYERYKRMYVPMPVMMMANSFCTTFLRLMFSLVIRGKNIVKKIPIANTKKDWNDSISRIKAMGAIMAAKETAAFPNMYIISFEMFTPIIALEFNFNAVKK